MSSCYGYDERERGKEKIYIERPVPPVMIYVVKKRYLEIWEALHWPCLIETCIRFLSKSCFVFSSYILASSTAQSMKTKAKDGCLFTKLVPRALFFSFFLFLSVGKVGNIVEIFYMRKKKGKGHLLPLLPRLNKENESHFDSLVASERCTLTAGFLYNTV